MKIITLMTCDSAIEANIIKGRLENEGVICFVNNENFSNLMPHYDRILGAGVQIMINEKDYDKAVEILGLNVEKKAVCPNCNSTNIKIGLGKNKLKKIFTIIASLLMVIPFNNINSVYTCKDCGTEFKL